MASIINHCICEIVLMGLLLLAATFNVTVAQIGVCNGRLGDNIIRPPQVVDLYNRNNIGRMRIYDPDQQTLEALRGSNIELILDVPNSDLQNIASSQDNANNWVQTNVGNYDNVRFRYIAVGNEVDPLTGTSQFAQFVLPALQNIYNAIQAAGLGNQIRVSTAMYSGLIENTVPPSNGMFRGEVSSYTNPIIQFLANTRAPLLVNIYPYFAYRDNQAQIPIGYALLASDSGQDMSDGTRYENLFYALLDSMYAAVEKSGGQDVEIVVSESGWPSAGGAGATVENARTYYSNLIQRVKGGTPRRPNRAIETYLFAMFDENNKNPEIEKHFGLFQPDGQPKYSISFN